MTPAEKLLWQEVRAKKLGVRFRRQQIIQGFIVDFYCHKAALVVEVDGDIHELQKDKDDGSACLFALREVISSSSKTQTSVPTPTARRRSRIRGDQTRRTSDQLRGRCEASRPRPLF